MTSRVGIRALRPLLRSSVARRWDSSSATRPKSPTSDFYKTFTRPVAKCLLLAMFTYQLAYFAWVKLETEEIRKKKTAEIAGLEEQVKELQKKAS
ncbi:hypothetical protein DL546_000190 [Coniochaeta pulveracea]|uniref:Inner membrane assembly complex subunit 17 n=1 Tax=Coniochaeta pulveracea TaxID=177199 RepID=A0A420Y1V6_9PEZI|nr:hypothetical protein DL546_000190 [Coniochaeta pulveracea]